MLQGFQGIRSVRVLRDKATGASKGMAFVVGGGCGVPRRAAGQCLSSVRPARGVGALPAQVQLVTWPAPPGLSPAAPRRGGC
jgi:hypothetical protein